jgi:glycosyltransferase involved in cell wall biosynthesis
MNKPKVLLISARSDTGGGPKQLDEILRYLREDAEFFVAAPNLGEYASFFQSSPTAYFELPQQKFSLKKLVGLYRFVSEHKIETVHSHGFGAGLYSRALKFSGVRVIHTFHGLHFNSGLKSKLKTFAEWFLRLFTDIHIAVSKSESQKAQKLGIEAKIIPNGLSSAQLQKKKTNLNWPPKTIGVLSRLDPHKNVAQVIEIFHYWKKKHPELKLLIAGEGEQEQYLIQKCKELDLEHEVQFLGFQETYQFFDRIDLLVSASLGEGLPYTILEAIGYGVPILCSDVDGHNDLLEEELLFNLESQTWKLPEKAPLSHKTPFSQDSCLSMIRKTYSQGNY